MFLTSARALWKQTSHLVQSRIPPSLRPVQHSLIPIRVEARQPIHPAAWLRQSRGRWYSTHSHINAAIRRFTTGASESIIPGVKYNKALFPKSRTATAVAGLTGRAPFASTLRPNLTGGALGRTAGGYALGSGRIGGARYFSHAPSAPAQVIQNVSQAVRAFYISGNKAQFNGVNQRGEKKYRAVSTTQHATTQKIQLLPKATPGSFVDFRINPTITALASLSTVPGFASSSEYVHFSKETLHTEGLLDVLSVDFSRALKDLAAVLTDLKQLSALGDLPITYQSNPAALRIHFPGCDAETVETLCAELSVQRGVVMQDPEFDAFVGTEIALLFPFAPTKAAGSDISDYMKAPTYHEEINWQQMMTPSMQSDEEAQSNQSQEDDYDLRDDENPWESEDGGSLSPEEYESLRSPSSGTCDPLEYQNSEGIYRFMELCDHQR